MLGTQRPRADKSAALPIDQTEQRLCDYLVGYPEVLDLRQVLRITVTLGCVISVFGRRTDLERPHRTCAFRQGQRRLRGANA